MSKILTPDIARAETIAAIATPPGRGGIGVVRVSGPATGEIAAAVLGSVPEPRVATYARFLDATGHTLDRGLALFFPEPHSFTGEDVVELHAHGGPVLLDLLVERTLQLGARLARPGEFSERAFLNGKIDLVQAEAIADLIDGATEEAVRGAARTLEGVFSRHVRALQENLTALRTYVEGSLDFPEEDVDFLSAPVFDDRLQALAASIETTLETAYQGSLLREGMNLVIVGQPNVGKSTLLNALAGRDSAIVTDIPGTTRDLVRESIQIHGMPLHVIDTAGLRETADPVERVGVERAWTALSSADAVILVVDDRVGLTDADQSVMSRLPEGSDLILVRNKIDLTGRYPSINRQGGTDTLYLSASSGDGLEMLREHLKGLMGYRSPEGTFMARRRHVDALRRALESLLAASDPHAARDTPEIVAEELRLAQQALGEITGEFTADDLLGEIFSSFCIGK